MTYTIALTDNRDSPRLLLATVPDGGDIAAAVSAEISNAVAYPERPGWIALDGLILTDLRPDDDTCIVWQGHELGWLIDETGRTWEYAVRPAD